MRYKVLVIRDQHALKPDDQLAFARRLGELEIHPFTPSLDGYPEILEFAHDGSADAREKWHTDLSFRQAPSMAAVLRAVVVPEFGRDTVFADMEAAYDGLSKPMQGFLHSLTAVHDWRNGRGY